MKLTPEQIAEIESGLELMGYCNKCGYCGRCYTNGVSKLLLHLRTEGKECGYAAAPLPPSKTTLSLLAHIRALQDERDAAVKGLREAVYAVAQGRVGCIGIGMIHSPQIGTEQVAQWREILKSAGAEP